MKGLPFIITALLLCTTLLAQDSAADSLPSLYTVTGVVVNVRSGPGTHYPQIDTRKRGDTVTVVSFANAHWAQIRLGDSQGYMSRKFLAYQGPLPEEVSAPVPTHRFFSVWDRLYSIVKKILWICAAVVIVGGMFGSDWGGAALLLQLICGIGALLGWMIFGNAKAGAVVGMGLGILFGLRSLLSIDIEGLGWITYLGWYLISMPFYLMDLLQFWLAKPWRPFMKRNILNDRYKKGMRIFLSILQVPFYIALFPLRFINAVYYNILVHNLYELSNYALEVVAPSDGREGGDGFWQWILYLPVRIAKYLLGHWVLTLIESVVWTVVDTFFPAVTLYHGTAAESTDSMLCEPHRNHRRKKESGWLSGIWNVGGGNYAGDGIYFGIYRKTLRNYQNGSAIVARVTMGKTVDAVLLPDNVYRQAGHPNAKAVSDWGLDHGYVSGEWWRSDRYTNWWEICLYDRQNKYNEMWRIRPIYAINSDSGIMQRVPGGTAHWLFRKMVINDIKYTFRQLPKRLRLR